MSLTKDDVIQIAEEHAAANELPWSHRNIDVAYDEEYPAQDGTFASAWMVTTNADRMGGNLYITVDATSGRVIEAIWCDR